MPSDSLLGRVRREFDRRTPTPFPVTRVRSLAATQKGAPTKHRKLADNLSITIGGPGDDEDGESGGGLYAWLSSLEVLCNTWSIAGVFDVEVGGHGSGVKARFCHWAQACEYLLEVSERAHEQLRFHTEESVLAWVTAVEHEIRNRAIELVRGVEQEVWGKALLAALKDKSFRWSEMKDVLVPRRAPPGNFGGPGTPKPSQAASSSSASGPPGVTPKAAAAAKVPPKRQWHTAGQTSRGVKICKLFNDQRGCAQNCPKGHAHVCDVQLASTKAACGSKQHNRKGHDAVRHGMPEV